MLRIYNNFAGLIAFRQSFRFFTCSGKSEKNASILGLKESGEQIFHFSDGKPPAKTKSLTLSLQAVKKVLNFAEKDFYQTATNYSRRVQGKHMFSRQKLATEKYKENNEKIQKNSPRAAFIRLLGISVFFIGTQAINAQTVAPTIRIVVPERFRVLTGQFFDLLTFSVTNSLTKLIFH